MVDFLRSSMLEHNARKQRLHKRGQLRHEFIFEVHTAVNLQLRSHEKYAKRIFEKARLSVIATLVQRHGLKAVGRHRARIDAILNELQRIETQKVMDARYSDEGR